jgi:hypothetical protein
MNGASMTSLPASAEAAGLPAAWLRDNCPWALCRDLVSGQRLLHITDIPADIAVAGRRASADSVEAVFHPDGHRAVFDRAWLAVHAAGGQCRGPTHPHTDNPYRDPAAMLAVRLAPGDCAVFDNTRILHARTGFASSGRRHLQGCYADLDGIESVAVAGRGDQPERTRRNRK